MLVFGIKYYIIIEIMIENNIIIFIIILLVFFKLVWFIYLFINNYVWKVCIDLILGCKERIRV